MARQRTDSKAQPAVRRRAPLLEAVDAGSGTGNDPPGGAGEIVVALHEAAQARYLNYALSVITARALPDVRDGLKPVQRRILYTMWRQRLTADAKPRKCAKVIGDVMGNYHPHGDTAIYDTLVRMAQPFSLRYPLVDGAGNFGSLDGDAAAAMRYTECRLAPISAELLEEIDQETVPFRDAYDGSRTEPVVLPARLPNLLVNGAAGIAVGMATNIPPHNLGEIADALLLLLDDPHLDSAQLARRVRGPDFPTGAQITNTADELAAIYRTGSGTIRVRATWESGPVRRSSRTVHVTSIPYMVNKSQVVERIAEIVVSRALPALLDVKDVSTGDVRIALELRADSDERLVMAYLFKHTPLETTFPVNMTCLVPSEQPGVGRPERLDLHQLLWHFLRFRLDVVTRRLEHELAGLRARIHILEGFERAFGALDAIITLIRASDGKADAAAKIVQLFPLDAEQTDAILELKIYRLARLEIRRIREELAAKRERAAEIGTLLHDEDRRWSIVRDEIDYVRCRHGDRATNPRRTIIDGAVEDVAFSADDFIVDEDAIVLVSADGWIKRQKEVRDLSSTRLREGDALLGRGGRQHAFDGRLLLQLRRRLHLPAHRGAGVDRLRRADPAAVQAAGRRTHRGRIGARSARDPISRRARRRPRAADSRRGRHERRLRPAFRSGAAPRAEHPGRAPFRAPGRQCGGRGRRYGHRKGNADRRNPPGPRPCSARRARSTSSPEPAAACASSSSTRPRTASSRSSRRAATAICWPSRRAGAASRTSAPASTRSRDAGDAAASCSSADASPATSRGP